MNFRILFIVSTLLGVLTIATSCNRENLTNDNKDGCYEKDFYNCLNCKKDCKYHQIMENYENKTHEKLKRKTIFKNEKEDIL